MIIYARKTLRLVHKRKYMFLRGKYVSYIRVIGIYHNSFPKKIKKVVNLIHVNYISDI